MSTPPPPPPPHYAGAPGPYGQQPNVREYPGGTSVMVLGILGIVICSILAPIALVKGNAARKAMAAQPHVTWTNQGQVTAGWVCGIVGTALLAIGVVIVVIAVAVGRA